MDAQHLTAVRYPRLKIDPLLRVEDRIPTGVAEDDHSVLVKGAGIAERVPRGIVIDHHAQLRADGLEHGVGYRACTVIITRRSGEVQDPRLGHAKGRQEEQADQV